MIDPQDPTLVNFLLPFVRRGLPLWEFLEAVKSAYLLATLKDADWDVTMASQHIRVHPSAIHQTIRRLEKQGFKSPHKQYEEEQIREILCRRSSKREGVGFLRFH